MTSFKDIRWEQRFSNYNKALKKLSEAVAYVRKDPENQELIKGKPQEIVDEILKEGLIQRFEYTHELAWNLMKDFLSEVGNITTYGSKDATREAFKAELITNGDVWMEMIESRNKTSHTFNQETADEIFTKILMAYYSAFLSFQQVMEGKRTGKQQSLF